MFVCVFVNLFSQLDLLICCAEKDDSSPWHIPAKLSYNLGVGCHAEMLHKHRKHPNSVICLISKEKREHVLDSGILEGSESFPPYLKLSPNSHHIVMFVLPPQARSATQHNQQSQHCNMVMQPVCITRGGFPRPGWQRYHISPQFMTKTRCFSPGVHGIHDWASWSLQHALCMYPRHNL